LFSCFLCNGIIFGIINTFGILFVKLRKDLEKNGDTDAAFKCSLVGSLTIGSTFFLSAIVGVIADKIGLRRTAIIGGIVATLGMALSSVFYYKIEVLYFTYGLMFGTGSSLVYSPSLTILGHYFRRRLGLANGIVTAGSSVATITFSFVNQHILSNHGLLPCLIMFTVLTGVLILCACTFIPVLPARMPATISDKNKQSPHHNQQQSKMKELFEKLVYTDNWRNSRYVIWALAIPCALFGYFVPYVHLVQFAKNLPLDVDTDVNEEKAASLMACIGVTSGIGRLVFGKLSDVDKIARNGNRIILQQIAFVSIGLCTMLMTAAPYFDEYRYQVLMLICCLMGIFDGCFITMLGPIAFDICGPAGAGQGIGFLLTLCSLPLTVGPPIAGIIYDYSGNYFGAFLGAGISPLVGAALMTAVRFVPSQGKSGVSALPEKEKSRTPLMLEDENLPQNA